MYLSVLFVCLVVCLFFLKINKIIIGEAAGCFS